MNQRPLLIEPNDCPRQSLRARWVFPVDGPPLENGTVEIAGERIAAVHSRNGPVTADLGNVALIPGLVNTHTHLELSDASQPLEPARPFTSWLQAVIGHRRRRVAAGDAVMQAVRAGADESLSAGTTLAGDIVSSDWKADPLSAAGPRGVAFLELLGLAPERIAPQCELARRHLTNGVPGNTGPWLVGLSPHAPYSVHPDLFAQLVELAEEFRAPLATHLAETRSELQLLNEGTGEFVDFLVGLGVWQPGAIPLGMRPLDYLKMLAKLTRALVIHGNYLCDEEIDFVAGCPGMSVVYCPRTHAWFGHDEHPWRRLLARGVNVALGTDSRASNPDLSLWNELSFLHARQPDFSNETLLELGTIRGARALGSAADTGSLTSGKRADLTIVSLPAIDSNDPHALLFHPGSRVIGGMCAGRWTVTP